MRAVLVSGMSALVLLTAAPDVAYSEQAKNADWQQYTQQMMTAARQAVQAIQNHDEQALFEAGNEALYPPCKNCHATYLPR